mmetsp:Transcript_103303/g.291677  ORF Transcript_103303/g.291677 Transcript_103303/m.291677 type:complete len:220 (-) Transcript_103303:35-694(-)
MAGMPCDNPVDAAKLGGGAVDEAAKLLLSCGPGDEDGARELVPPRNSCCACMWLTWDVEGGGAPRVTPPDASAGCQLTEPRGETAEGRETSALIGWTPCADHALGVEADCDVEPPMAAAAGAVLSVGVELTCAHAWFRAASDLGVTDRDEAADDDSDATGAGAPATCGGGANCGADGCRDSTPDVAAATRPFAMTAPPGRGGHCCGMPAIPRRSGCPTF